ncbi:UDP-N-acetylmuramate dehydrogenase [Candidatus Dependentiae bacterium]|nr:UDP-N-acetylmuramate dehydrogenase [Candidatus Dependentiae bacterium]
MSLLNESLNLNALPKMVMQQQVPLADKNWFRTGGHARYYCQPTTELEFVQALFFAQHQGLSVFVLGQGANILISDDGFDGLVIHPKLQKIEQVFSDAMQAVCVKAEAGVVFDDLIEYCLNNNLIQLEEFSGIPGTVGGSIYINIHYYEFFLSDFLIEATVIDRRTGVLSRVDKAWFEFGYDTSKLHDQNYFLINATFMVKKASNLEISYARGRKKEIIRHRVRRFPTTHTCGSFFRNFFPAEVAKTDKKLIYVAYYLDKLGIKGELCVGDAVVSHQHANMLVNRGSATSSDIFKLAKIMQEKVLKEFGIIPQPECQLIGFRKDQLL